MGALRRLPERPRAGPRDRVQLPRPRPVRDRRAAPCRDGRAAGVGQPYSGLLRFYGINDAARTSSAATGARPGPPRLPVPRPVAAQPGPLRAGTVRPPVPRSSASPTRTSSSSTTSRIRPAEPGDVRLPVRGQRQPRRVAAGASEPAPPWITETEWLPRADGYLIGQSLLWDRLMYTARGDVGYAGLRPRDRPAAGPADRPAGRHRPVPPAPAVERPVRPRPGPARPLRGNGPGPLHRGPDLDNAPNPNPPPGRRRSPRTTRVLTLPARPRPVLRRRRGRGVDHPVPALPGGVQRAVQRPRPVPQGDVGANYFAAYSDTPYTRFPQLDRLADDASDLAYRMARPRQPRRPRPGRAGPGDSPLYDPQRYAIRRVVITGTTPSTPSSPPLDVGSGSRPSGASRGRTHRGLDGAGPVGVGLPGRRTGQLRGDVGVPRVPLPVAHRRPDVGLVGRVVRPDRVRAAVLQPGAYFNRPDGTIFYFMYRHTDPFKSRALTASVSYNLSRKYR